MRREMPRRAWFQGKQNPTKKVCLDVTIPAWQLLSEMNDLESVTMTKAGTSIRKLEAECILEVITSFSYPPVKEHSALLLKTRLSNQLSVLIAPFQYYVS